jgi:class 3 adenylate cyclase
MNQKSENRIEDLLASARKLTKKHKWQEAEALLDSISEDELTGEAYSLRADCVFWQGTRNREIGLRERAFSAYVKENDTDNAALMAINLSLDYFHKEEDAVGRSWKARADKLIDETSDSISTGWMNRWRSSMAYDFYVDYQAALEFAEKSLAIAEKQGDPNLRAMALHDKGRALVALGEAESGLQLMEDVMVSTVAGELDPMTTGSIYCNMIGTCGKLADYRSASQWDDAARRWCERVGQSSGFPGTCRVKRSTIMRLRGIWVDAESEAKKAAHELVDYPDTASMAYEEIGTIRLLSGDLSGSNKAFNQAIKLGQDPEPGFALLKVAENDLGSAHALMTRAFNSDERTALDIAHLVPARTEISIAVGDIRAAEVAIKVGKEAAERFGTEALKASSHYSFGVFNFSQGDNKLAEKEFTAAAKQWRSSNFPYETAKARFALAKVYDAMGQVDLAGLEVDAARASFEELGAKLALKEAVRFIELRTGKSRTVQAAWLFTDIVGSTELLQAIGDEAWSNVLRWHNETVREEIQRCKGREINNTGDGFFVEFDSPTKAVVCAVAIQKVLARQRAAEGYPARVRMGIHSGDALESSGSRLGSEVHRTARVASAASADEILVTRVIREQVDHPLGESRMIEAKGFDEPIEVFPLHRN